MVGKATSFDFLVTNGFLIPLLADEASHIFSAVQAVHSWNGRDQAPSFKMLVSPKPGRLEARMGVDPTISFPLMVFFSDGVGHGFETSGFCPTLRWGPEVIVPVDFMATPSWHLSDEFIFFDDVTTWDLFF
jgi:hypothetical protein